MIVAVMTIDVALFEAMTLKDKRRVLQSFVTRLRDKFNVSVTEVGYGDSPKRSKLGVAAVSTDTRAAHAVLDKIVEMVRHTGGMTLLTYEREML
jgi:uncharacterized protein YlxP (DUF503 family)